MDRLNPVSLEIAKEAKETYVNLSRVKIVKGPS